MKILQVSYSDQAGGAEKIAYNLFYSYKNLGHLSWLLVGNKKTKDQYVIQIPKYTKGNNWQKFWYYSAKSCRSRFFNFRGGLLFCHYLEMLGNPVHYTEKILGHEDFEYKGIRDFFDYSKCLPDIIHCHNLHTDFFDLGILPDLSNKFPVVLTLHDAWLMSGHCAHSFDCNRWKIGCGQCPDLAIYPAIWRDATHHNWKKKQSIFSKSNLFLITPSAWLMNIVDESMLNPAIIKKYVIPNGVNLQIFSPYPKEKARSELGLPQNAKILLFVANGIRKNPFKDYITLRAAIVHISKKCNKKILFIALGERAHTEVIGNAVVRFIPFEENEVIVARYCQAADIYIYASRADTFPTTILEALACGTPVVATSIGGIPEQIIDSKTGFLTPYGDDEILAQRVIDLFNDQDMRDEMSRSAAKDAKERFSLEQMTRKYLNFYHEILKI